jgi:Zn-dependent protease
MTQTSSIRLFRLAGIDVYLHWSWLVVAFIEIEQRRSKYTSLAWNVIEYLVLFAIVLMHEFGHSLACRQVGGVAFKIMLWPLGGVAFVSPPNRPGATLWSIAAGPLVNVVLLGVFSALISFATTNGIPVSMPNLYRLLHAIWYMNLGLLIFNMLPVYPLDGGQILRSLLWFVCGPAWSLLVTSIIGVIGALALAGLALLQKAPLLGLIAIFMILQCVRGIKASRRMMQPASEPPISTQL